MLKTETMEQKKIVFSVDIETWNKLKAKADEMKVSLSVVMRLLITKYLSGKDYLI